MADELDAKALLEGTTPGPWSANKAKGGGYYIDTALGVDSTNAYVIAELSGRDVRANARLAAAAPDLARACIANAERIAELGAEVARLDNELRQAANALTDLGWPDQGAHFMGQRAALSEQPTDQGQAWEDHHANLCRIWAGVRRADQVQEDGE